ncbi:MFS transporter [Paucibacter sp. APW11]|uniref:MFS transporter n=1 Tax=Roseateles aquae TaxID=3077235 RepID=A0ABU3PJ04_9BURK|nr:MFS transporter [Paucibacter sp. APW11]MDT9002026.1 MFS transporter [Paucibacter sp. APW11]
MLSTGPLSRPAFRRFYLAKLWCNLGAALQGFATVWLMASSSPAALDIALVQTLASAPLLLLTLPAGVLADLLDRATLLFWVHGGIALLALLVGLAALQLALPVSGLLMLSACSGIATALLLPVWQACVAGQVEAEELPELALLNNLSFNAAALLGPAIGALLLGHLGSSRGAAWLYLLHALLSLPMLACCWRARRLSGRPGPSAQRLVRALGSGLRTAWSDASYRQLLGCSLPVFAACSALPSLLPLLVRDVLHGRAGLLGSLQLAMGSGAVLVGLTLPALRRQWRVPSTLPGLALLLYGLALLGLVLAPSLPLRLACMVAAGMAWAIIVSAANAQAQAAFGERLRARTLALYLMAVAAGQTLGSLGWGLLAERAGAINTLVLAAIALIAMAASGSSPLTRARPLKPPTVTA